MNPRTDILHTANTLINGDRNNQHGEPTQDFTRTAALWTTYLDGRTTLQAHDVAAMMALLKISRLSWNPTNQDNWIDLAGYAACGWETLCTPTKSSTTSSTNSPAGAPKQKTGKPYATN